MRVGARSLGLSVTWRYHFVGHGTLLEPARDTVALDVGGQLCAGVIDQHQDGGLARSTSELLLRFPELVYGHLMNGWLERRDDGQALQGRAFAPTIVTHAAPDFDAMVSAWLVKQLVEQGAYPPCAAALVEYASRVDQGAWKVDLGQPDLATDALHLAYLMIMNQEEWRNDAMLERGFRLLDVALSALVADVQSPWKLRAEHFTPRADGPLRAWRNVPEFAEVSAALLRDFAAYRDVDKPAADASRTCLLPAADHGEPIRVPVFVAPVPTKSKLNKYWVRADGFPFFICPLADAPNVAESPRQRAASPSRVILSLDPTWRTAGGRRPTLQGLGFRLEQAEAARRRDGGATDPRGQPPRYEDGSCDNADPWYDGRGHDHTIVDTPRAGTVLAFDEIVAIATSEFWKVRLIEATVHVAIPVRGADVERLFSGGKIARRPTVPVRAAEGLRAWFDESREIGCPRIWPGGFGPEGYSVSAHVVRRFPGATETTVRLVELRLDSKAERVATVEDLAHWLDAQSQANNGRIYFMARIDVERGSHVVTDLDRLVAGLCLGSVQRAPLTGDQQIVFFNRRAIAIRPRSVTPCAWVGDRELLYREMLLYAAFQAESLDTYLGRVLEAVQPGHVKRGTNLWRDFLEFHARFVHADVATDDDVSSVFAGLRDAMSLSARHKKVSRELKRLDQIERDEGEEIKDYILFGIGLTGVIQAWYAIEWPGFPAENGGLFLAVLGTVGLAYAGRRRLTRLFTRGRPRAKVGAELSMYEQSTKTGGP